MSNRERRLSPRKDCIVPLRIRIVANSYNPSEQPRSGMESKDPGPYLRSFEGHSENLSERGIRFKCSQRVSVGQSVEMYLTIPREVTGRMSEPVRCSARVVHVDQQEDADGMLGVGAAVARFEPISTARDWGN